MVYPIQIREGTIEEIVSLSKEIPEFHNPYPSSIYESRFEKSKFLILVAETDKKIVGFKAGYERDADGSFYSWMGGVLTEFRRRGVAEQLAEKQEEWARKNGYQFIRFKTLNRHRGMLLFAIKRGFNLTGVEPREPMAENRIWLLKEL